MGSKIPKKIPHIPILISGYIPPILEFTIILNVRQPRMEKSGSYCFIGVGPLKNQTPPSH
jgi:hypothetical protein